MSTKDNIAGYSTHFEEGTIKLKTGYPLVPQDHGFGLGPKDSKQKLRQDNDIINNNNKLAHTEYKGRYDNVARQLCGKCALEIANSWYEQKPEGVVESENFKVLWDFTVQCDRKIEARRPDIVFIHKKETEIVMIEVTILGDDRKELENG